MFLTEVKLSY